MNCIWKQPLKRWLCLGLLAGFCLSAAACSKVDNSEPASQPSQAVSPALTEGPEATLSPEPTQEAMPPLYDVPEAEPVLGTRLCEHYQGYFTVGTCISNAMLSNPKLEKLVLEQFNTVTCENETKPDALLNQMACVSKNEVVVMFPKRTTEILDWAKEHNLKVRGHVLVWHSQTPDWFFKEGFKNEGALVSREVMLQRMESYIKQVLEYCNTNYPGLVYVWDVANEVFEDGNGEYRNSYWYQIVGEDFVRYAFEYARKYAEPGTKLFYNDFNCYIDQKQNAIMKVVKELAELGLIDGIGMQSHLDVDYPSVESYTRTLERFSKLGLEVQITELDVTTSGSDEASFRKQGEYYDKLFQIISMYEKLGSTNITGLTVWGVSDIYSWRSSQYPLLFDAALQPKPAYYGVLQEKQEQ